VLNTRQGTFFVDRWPDAQTVVVQNADNYTLRGAAHALTPADVQPHIKGFVEASAEFVPLLQTVSPEFHVWPRIMFAQQAMPDLKLPIAYEIRRLVAVDAPHLQQLSSDSIWISKTWGGPVELAASGYGWGAFVAGQLAAVACTFFLGDTYEDIGVVTEPQFRGLGLSTACALALCHDIYTRGHQPGWTTSPDNTASVRVAEKLGFTVYRQDFLYVIGIPIPQPAALPDKG
jgi:GNAT superfamily N-acetyltransferase